MKNGSATPREESLAKQTQVMLLRGWSAEDVAQSNFKIYVKLEPWLRRYSGKKGASKLYSNFLKPPSYLEFRPGGPNNFFWFSYFPSIYVTELGLLAPDNF